MSPALSHRAARTYRLTRAALVALVIAIPSVFAAVWSMPASAATIPSAITGVTVTPATGNIYTPVVVTATWCVPNGSQHNDTFTLELPSQLQPLTSGFPLKDAQGDVIANAVVVARLVTFTLTDFAQTHTSVCGNAFFSEKFISSQTLANQPNVLDFTTPDHVFQQTVTPTVHIGTGVRTAPLKYGSWTDASNQNEIDWKIDTATAPAVGWTGASFSDTTSPGLSFVCSSLSLSIGDVNVRGNFADGSALPASAYSKTCADGTASVAGSLTVTTNIAIPAGDLVHLFIRATVSDVALTSYSNTAQVAANGATAQSVHASLARNDAGGLGSGVLVPPVVVPPVVVPPVVVPPVVVPPVVVPPVVVPPIVTLPSSSAASTSSTPAIVIAAAGSSIPVSVNAGHPGSPARGDAGLELLGGAFVLAALGGLGGSALRRRRLDV